MMTMRALQWAFDIEGILPIEKLVLIALAERSGVDSDSGQTIAKATDEELAQFACCSVDVAEAAVDRLWADRLIGGGIDHCYPLHVGARPKGAPR